MPISLVLRGKQIKATRRPYFKCYNQKDIDNNKCYEDVEKFILSYIAGEDVKVILLCKTMFPIFQSFQLLKILNIELLFNPAMPLPAIYPREMKTYAHTKPYT